MSRWVLLAVEDAGAGEDLRMALSMLATGLVNGVPEPELAREHGLRLIERAAPKVEVVGGGIWP